MKEVNSHPLHRPLPSSHISFPLLLFVNITDLDRRLFPFSVDWICRYMSILNFFTCLLYTSSLCFNTDWLIFSIIFLCLILCYQFRYFCTISESTLAKTNRKCPVPPTRLQCRPFVSASSRVLRHNWAAIKSVQRFQFDRIIFDCRLTRRTGYSPTLNPSSLTFVKTIRRPGISKRWVWRSRSRIFTLSWSDSGCHQWNRCGQMHSFHVVNQNILTIHWNDLLIQA